MGFDNHINEAIKAARIFKKKHNDLSIILVGRKNEINKYIKKNEFDIHDCPDIVEMTDSPMTAIRKTKSSMYNAIKLVEDNYADGVLSAGSTSCFVTISYLILKTIKGVTKPAFMSFLPTTKNKITGMLDVGANKNCSGLDLYIFAKMANIYFNVIEGYTKPKIGIINIGTEEKKGFEYHHVANEKISNDKSLNYLGFIEPRYILNGHVDILISDGYSGNIVLKSIEGALKAISSVMRSSYKMPYNWLAPIFSFFSLQKIKKTFDYKKRAGAIVLGLNKPVVKTHGSADCQQFLSSLDLLYRIIKNNICSKLKKELTKEHGNKKFI